MYGIFTYIWLIFTSIYCQLGDYIYTYISPTYHLFSGNQVRATAPWMYVLNPQGVTRLGGHNARSQIRGGRDRGGGASDLPEALTGAGGGGGRWWARRDTTGRSNPWGYELFLYTWIFWFSNVIYIVGGWATHLKNMRKSNWIIFPGKGENNKHIWVAAAT